MIYKNGIQEYTLIGVIFGGLMGIFLGLSHQSLWYGILGGLASGVLFALLMLLFIKAMEKKFDAKREEIAKERHIHCDGAATVAGNGGWMFLTENELEFYPHKINCSRRELHLPLSSLRSVSVRGNTLQIAISDGTTCSVVVSQSKDWERQLNAVIAALPQKG